ncbi:hypothetical protein HZH66_001355 [Vespula vulgaris]|uniref:Uncharacterized protein n=1 Tax=Vespula vulgaris TaxID=7454 RepID=A0A834NLK0_VESVU|nr:hypothetical protein HZH66_001355 [Vespula vulgaris]
MKEEEKEDEDEDENEDEDEEEGEEELALPFEENVSYSTSLSKSRSFREDPSGHSPHELTNYRGRRTRSSPMAISAFRTEILAYRTKSSFAVNEVSIDLKADKQTFL